MQFWCSRSTFGAAAPSGAKPGLAPSPTRRCAVVPTGTVFDFGVGKWQLPPATLDPPHAHINMVMTTGATRLTFITLPRRIERRRSADRRGCPKPLRPAHSTHAGGESLRVGSQPARRRSPGSPSRIDRTKSVNRPPGGEVCLAHSRTSPTSASNMSLSSLRQPALRGSTSGGTRPFDQRYTR